VARSGKASSKERRRWAGLGRRVVVRGDRWEPQAAWHDGLRQGSCAAEVKQRRKKKGGGPGANLLFPKIPGTLL
jgi:hypothetical protein